VALFMSVNNVISRLYVEYKNNGGGNDQAGRYQKVAGEAGQFVFGCHDRPAQLRGWVCHDSLSQAGHSFLRRGSEGLSETGQEDSPLWIKGRVINNSANPVRVKQTAAFAFTETHPDKMLFSTATSAAQPINTMIPTITDRYAAMRTSLIAEVLELEVRSSGIHNSLIAVWLYYCMVLRITLLRTRTDFGCAQKPSARFFGENKTDSFRSVSNFVG
jgi:hypothetical protein